MKHPLTDEICDALWDENGQYYALYEEVRLTCRAAYDVGYAQALEDVSDLITCLQRKDSSPEPITLEELEAMRSQVVDLPQANSDVCGEEGMERARQQTFEENDELMRLLSDS